MKNILDLQRIEISKIDISISYSLHPFETSFSPDTEISIETIGIIHPPIVQKKDATYQLICGQKRLSYLQRNNLAAAQCLILPEEIPAKILLELILTDQQLNNPLTIIERAYFLKLCSEHISTEETIQLFAAKVPFRKHQTAIEEHLNLLSFDSVTLVAIHENIVAEQTALTLLAMNKADEKSIVDLMTQLRPGAGKQRRIFSLLRDVCGRGNISIASYLEKQEVRDILDHQEMNIPQKTQQLTDSLQAATTPLLIHAEKNFIDLKQQLNLPKHLTLNHSPAFEKDDITLSLIFKNLDKFKQKWPDLMEDLKKFSF